MKIITLLQFFTLLGLAHLLLVLMVGGVSALLMEISEYEKLFSNLKTFQTLYFIDKLKS